MSTATDYERYLALKNDKNIAELEALDDALFRRGFMCSVSERGDTEMALQMLVQARVAIEAEFDEDVAPDKVVNRVTDAFSVLYGFDAVAR